MNKYNKKYTFKQALHIIKTTKGYQMSLPEWSAAFHLRLYEMPDIEDISLKILRNIISNFPKGTEGMSTAQFLLLCKTENAIKDSIKFPTQNYLYLHNKYHNYNDIYFLTSEETKRKDWRITKI